MKASPSQKIKVGVFVLIGLVVFAGGVFVIGQNKNIWGNTIHIYGTFKNVSGLQIGNNVRFVGINIGTVDNISIISDTFARVDMRLQNKIRPFLKRNAVASISSDGLMGDKLVVITASPENAGLLESGGRIKTVDPANFDKALNKLTVVADNAEKITNSLATIFSDISHGKGNLGTLLYDDTLARSIKSTVKSANNTMKSIQEGSKGFSENMKAVKHNFLLRGYFKRKERKEKERLEKNNTKNEVSDSTK